MLEFRFIKYMSEMDFADEVFGKNSITVARLQMLNAAPMKELASDDVSEKPRSTELSTHERKNVLMGSMD